MQLSGLSEEGSVYDSEEDKKALKEAKRKRQSYAQKEKDSSKKKKNYKTKKSGVSRIGCKYWRSCVYAGQVNVKVQITYSFSNFISNLVLFVPV
jgi:hypothetical protein